MNLQERKNAILILKNLNKAISAGILAGDKKQTISSQARKIDDAVGLIIKSKIKLQNMLLSSCGVCVDDEEIKRLIEGLDNA